MASVGRRACGMQILQKTFARSRGFLFFVVLWMRRKRQRRRGCLWRKRRGNCVTNALYRSVKRGRGQKSQWHITQTIRQRLCCFICAGAVDYRDCGEWCPGGTGSFVRCCVSAEKRLSSIFEIISRATVRIARMRKLPMPETGYEIWCCRSWNR